MTDPIQHPISFEPMVKGEYVRWADYQAIVNERDDLFKELRKAQNTAEDLLRDCTDLANENSQLRKRLGEAGQ